ncbi:hypothetical protein [Clostridium formicaceticum]|uniref:Spore coat protein n=1 Tax=Clostridium formicaceticum TaxID=1497 RepID=A0AAC9WGQ5_9CLOT|nr:hypothetical protein [Clostridium formicaceticum]AOY77603.1 hypothetical protein BJL90_18115 [Clostridium formicaceticum]ARE88183.1 hypothetical protein CLFO_25840 [Clostridium formicaceticum]
MKNIATKEVNYIKDFLSWELLSLKKCYQYSQQETNPARQQAYLEGVRVHQQNYMNILNYINQVNITQGNNYQVNVNQGGQMN